MVRSELKQLMVTEWLVRDGKCGPTSFEGVTTNLGWCKAEVDRLRKKGIVATVGTSNGMVAVFKVPDRMTTKELNELIEEVGQDGE